MEESGNVVNISHAKKSKSRQQPHNFFLNAKFGPTTLDPIISIHLNSNCDQLKGPLHH